VPGPSEVLGRSSGSRYRILRGSDGHRQRQGDRVGSKVEKFNGDAIKEPRCALEIILDPPPDPGEKLKFAIQRYQEARWSRLLHKSVQHG
jgi:hypothetical protein